MEAVLTICCYSPSPNLITLLISASNYIISGSTGFEAAKACAVIDDVPRALDQDPDDPGDPSQLLTTPPVSVKTGKNLLFFPTFTGFYCIIFSGNQYSFVSTLLSKYLNELNLFSSENGDLYLFHFQILADIG